MVSKSAVDLVDLLVSQTVVEMVSKKADLRVKMLEEKSVVTMDNVMVHLLVV